ncbi:MAG: hypothetical protein ACRCVV_01575 [Shewanella sp.]
MDEFFKSLSTMSFNKGIALLGIIGISVLIMLKIFSHMKEGFGIYNTRITDIAIIAIFVSILAVLSPNYESAAIGILGAIAGYLFGFGHDNKQGIK